jgi:hypothetical protein
MRLLERGGGGGGALAQPTHRLRSVGSKLRRQLSLRTLLERQLDEMRVHSRSVCGCGVKGADERASLGGELRLGSSARCQQCITLDDAAVGLR